MQTFEDEIEILQDISTTSREGSQPKQYPIQYKLGQEIANGIKYFGQDRQEKYGKLGKKQRVALCVCTCGEAWRVVIQNVQTGNTKSCGNCKKG